MESLLKRFDRRRKQCREKCIRLGTGKARKETN